MFRPRIALGVTSSLVAFAALAIVFAGPVAATRQSDVDLKVFAGSWTENPAKSHGTISKELTYTFREDGDGFIAIERGRIQLRDRVRFDGREYPTPDIPGRATSWTQISSNVYQITIRNKGEVNATGKWTLSDGGRRLTQETTRSEPQAPTNIIEYIRKSGSGDSLIGVWEPVSSTMSQPSAFVLTLSDATTLTFTSVQSGVSYTVRPDGKEYDAQSGGAFDTKAVVIGKGPRTFQRTTFRRGTPLLEAVWTVSPDGQTLTLTTRGVGSSDDPSVLVYERRE
jgi:hypothetical protein